MSTATKERRLDLRDYCEDFTAHDDARPVKVAEWEAAKADLAVADAEAARWAAYLADPASAARDGIPAESVIDSHRLATNAAYSAAVRVNTLGQEVTTLESKRKACARNAAERMGEVARTRLAEIQARYDAGRRQAEEAAAAEQALILEFSQALGGVFHPSERWASYYGIAVRAA